MGAWGHDHFDNDTAQDLICMVRIAVEKELRKVICTKHFNQTHYWGVIAAAALVAEQGDCCGVSFPPVTGSSYRFYDLVDPAIEKLQKIFDDDSFFKEWDSLDAKTHAVLSLLQRLRYMQAEQESRAAKHAKRFRRKRPRKHSNPKIKNAASPGEINSMDPSPAAIKRAQRETAKGVKDGTVKVTYATLNPSKRKSK